MRSWRARLLALIAAALLLMPATALAEVVYRCKMSGAIGPKCGCDRAELPRGDDGADDRVEAPSCCELKLQSTAGAVGTYPGPAPSVGSAVLTATLQIDELMAASGFMQHAALHQARGPPGAATPVYIQNCSLLR